MSWIALVTVAAFTLSACSSLGGKDAEMSTPMTPYFEAIWSSENWSEEKMEERTRQEQDYVAACMAKQGFEYIPDVQNNGVMSFDEDEDGPQWGTLEFAETYGYGMIKSPYQEVMPDNLPEYFDPNEDYVMSLSDSERDAYYEALWGPSPSEEDYAQMELDDNFEWNPENQGCYGEANEKFNQMIEPEIFQDPEFEDIMEGLDTMYNEINEDARLTELDTKWVNCMAEAGFAGHTDRWSAQDQLMNEWNALQESLNPDMGENGEWVEPSEAQKEEFFEKEVAAAVADHKCYESLDYDRVYNKVQTEYEEKFVAQNKAKLDALVAKVQASSNS